MKNEVNENAEAFKEFMEELRKHHVTLSSYYADIKIKNIGYDKKFSKFYEFVNSDKNKDERLKECLYNQPKYKLDDKYCLARALAIITNKSMEEINAKLMEATYETGITFASPILTQILFRNTYELEFMPFDISAADTIHMYQDKYKKYILFLDEHAIAITDGNTINENIDQAYDFCNSEYNASREDSYTYARFTILGSKVYSVLIPRQRKKG